MHSADQFVQHRRFNPFSDMGTKRFCVFLESPVRPINNAKYAYNLLLLYVLYIWHVKVCTVRSHAVIANWHLGTRCMYST
jgi:hypothetical protein